MSGKFHMKTRAGQTEAVGGHVDGYFILENMGGQAVRSFAWQAKELSIIYRHDTRRVQTVADVSELKEQGIQFDVLATTTKEMVVKKPVEIKGRGKLKWVPAIVEFNNEFDLEKEVELEPKKAIGYSAAFQLGLAGLIIIAGYFSGPSEKPSETTAVTLIPQETVQKILEQEPTAPKSAQVKAQQETVIRQKARDIVVAPSMQKITKNTPVPTKSTSFKRGQGKGPRGGGYKSDAPLGYGTNEKYMNSIGALGALNGPRVKGGNGGRGGVNLQAVGVEPGSGAGGKGHGGFGSNGGGGRGLGGLGRGHGQGLANSMYGKGLIAAPFGDGSPAPGVGGYGTRGRMGGGAQGAGYGTTTVVGSWKGTGPKGIGPAGSGVGNGDPNGSPYGLVDGDDSGAVVTGGLDMDSIRDVIMRNMGQIRYCYEQGLQRQPTLAGRVSVGFQIAGSGGVSVANIRHSSVRSAQVESCIVGKIRNWKFPKPHGGVNVAVVYPFNLQRTVSMR